jgi:hypothetical protein
VRERGEDVVAMALTIFTASSVSYCFLDCILDSTEYVLPYCADNGRTASTTKQDLLHEHFWLHMGIYRLLLRSLGAYYAFIISSANPKV